MPRTQHLSVVPSGVLRCRITFTFVAPPRFETPALEAHKVIPEFRTRVTYLAEGAKKFAYHQFLHGFIASGYIDLDALIVTSL